MIIKKINKQAIEFQVAKKAMALLTAWEEIFSWYFSNCIFKYLILLNFSRNLDKPMVNKTNVLRNILEIMHALAIITFLKQSFLLFLSNYYHPPNVSPLSYSLCSNPLSTSHNTFETFPETSTLELGILKENYSFYFMATSYSFTIYLNHQMGHFWKLKFILRSSCDPWKSVRSFAADTPQAWQDRTPTQVYFTGQTWEPPGPVAGPLVGGDSWSDRTGQRGIQRQMSASNSLTPMDPLLASSLVVSERESENIVPQDAVPGRAKGPKREESGDAGGNGTFWHRAIWIYRQKNFKPAPRKGKQRQIRQLFLKRAFGIIVYLRLLQMLLFVFLFICWVKNILK